MKKACFLSLLAFFLSCSNNNVAGTGSETDTGCAVAGLIQYADRSYVAGADVILHDQRLIKRITLGKRLASSALIRSGSTKTNINGFFRIDSVDTGGYLVEINDHDTLGAVLPAKVNKGDTLVTVNGTLTHCGTIIGRVDTSEYHGSKTAQIYLPELGRTITIDSLGYFTINNLPAWNYYLRLAVGDSIVLLPSDTLRVPVTEKDTTRVLSLGAKTGTVIINGKVIENPNHQ
jgi:hypothetical protein